MDLTPDDYTPGPAPDLQSAATRREARLTLARAESGHYLRPQPRPVNSAAYKALRLESEAKRAARGAA